MGLSTLFLQVNCAGFMLLSARTSTERQLHQPAGVYARLECTRSYLHHKKHYDNHR